MGILKNTAIEMLNIISENELTQQESLSALIDVLTIIKNKNLFDESEKEEPSKGRNNLKVRYDDEEYFIIQAPKGIYAYYDDSYEFYWFPILLAVKAGEEDNGKFTVYPVSISSRTEDDNSMICIAASIDNALYLDRFKNFLKNNDENDDEALEKFAKEIINEMEFHGVYVPGEVKEYVSEKKYLGGIE